ncbi:MAG: aspartyl protease family protein [Cyclobacteriaceae bacterium]|nr:aspartyl protease family protein [Cyclobacteriaceae bacterium]
MRVRYFVVLLLLLPGICPAQLGFHLKPGQRRVQFPIEVINNLVIVPVVINGQLPLRFILDTGVRTTILTEKAFSDILNLQYSRYIKVAGPGEEKLVEAYITNDVTLDLPGIHGQGHAMLVLEKDYLELRNYMGTDVQGILGYELFSRFVVEIDYEGRHLTITAPDAFKRRKKYQELSISVEDTKPYVSVPVTLQNNTRLETKLLVDTGASHGLVLDPQSDERIVVPEKHINSLIGRGLAGTISGQVGRIHSIEFGSYTLHDVVTNFPNPGDYGFNDSIKAGKTFRHGALGGDLLRRFTVVFNFPMEKIYFRKNASFSRKFTYNLSGLTFKAKGVQLRRFEITDVRKGSSADLAGIEAGDELVSVNGLLASQFSLNSLNSAFDLRPGKKILIEIMREGKVLKKKMVLVNQI